MMFYYRSVILLSILLILNAGCGGSSPSLQSSNIGSVSNAIENLEIVSQTPELPALSSLLAIRQEKLTSGYRVSLLVSESCTTDRLLYHLNYDAQVLFPVDTKMMPILGNPDSIQVIATRIPGIIGLGQVSPGLELINIEAGELFAVIDFEKGIKTTAQGESAVEDVGLKLRSEECVEFQNADVPFQVQSVADTNTIEVIWEEANDGDYNGNGLVDLYDITRIGQFFGRYLDHDPLDDEPYAGYDSLMSDPELPDGYYIVRDESEDGEDHLNIRGIGINGIPAQNPYEPVQRGKSGGGDPLAWDPGDVRQDDIYFVNVGDYTPVNQHFMNSTRDGYRLYVCTCLPGTTPDESLFVSEGEPRTEDEWRVFRPKSVERDYIYDLGMGEYNTQLGEYLTYIRFLEDKCTGELQRLGSAPFEIVEGKYAVEPPLYKKIIDPGELPPNGDSYVLVTPLPGSAAVDLFAGGSLGAYTFHAIPGATAIVPEGINWLNNESGLQEVQLGDTPEWPEGGERDLRLRFGQAELEWGSQTPDPNNWEVRYAVYYQYDDQGSVYPSPLALPPLSRRYFPDVTEGTIRLAVVDLEHPGTGNWLQPLDASCYAGLNVEIGVMAYAYVESQVGDNRDDIRITRKFFGPVTDTIITLIPDDILEDLTPPEGVGRIAIDDPLFQQAFYLSSTLYSNGVDYAAVAIARYHMKDVTYLNDHYRRVSFFMRNALQYDYIHDIIDYGENPGVRRDDEELKLRLEIYRTELDKQTLLDSIATSGGFIQWRNSLIDSFDYETNDHLQLYAIARAQPRNLECNPEFEPNFMIGINDYWVEFDIDGDDVMGFYTNVSPAFPYCIPEDAGYFNTSSDPPHAMCQENDYYSELWKIESLYTSGFFLFGVDGEIKCDSRYYQTRLPVYFTPHNFFEQLPGRENDEKEPENKWKYFSVYAIDDPMMNCSYLPYSSTDPLEPQIQAERTITWHGHVPFLYMNDPVSQEYWEWETTKTEDEYFEYLCDSTGWTNLPRGASSGAGTLEGRQARYPDIAYNPTDSTIGISFFDPLAGSVKVREINTAASSSQTEEVDLASPGDTSIVYGDSGTPHVAYLKLFLEGEEDPVGGPYVSRGGSSVKTASVQHTGGLYYRYRSSGNWSEEEPIDDSGYLNSVEHFLHILKRQGQLDAPCCVLPSGFRSTSGLYGVPGRSVREGAWSTIPLTTNNAGTQLQMDSIEVLNGDQSTIYVLMHDPIENSLILGTLENGAAWNTQVVVPSGVNGYPSIAHFPDDSLRICFMGSDDNRLHYGTLNGASYLEEYVSERRNYGYQSALTFNQDGRPIIFSIYKDWDQLAVTTIMDDFSDEMALEFAGASDELIEANTINVARNHNELGPAKIAVVWLTKNGVLRWCELDMQ